jgi:hypothetical protein
LAQARISAQVCSATAAALAPAAALTAMPRFFAASTSMVSMPVPCLEITRRRGLAAITRSVMRP